MMGFYERKEFGRRAGLAAFRWKVVPSDSRQKRKIVYHSLRIHRADIMINYLDLV